MKNGNSCYLGALVTLVVAGGLQENYYTVHLPIPPRTAPLSIQQLKRQQQRLKMRQWDHLSEAAPPPCSLPGACADGCQVIHQTEAPHTDENLLSWNTHAFSCRQRTNTRRAFSTNTIKNTYRHLWTPL